MALIYANRPQLLRQDSDLKTMSQQQLDEVLVERAQQGDKRAFDLLVLRYQHRVAGLIARSIGGDAEILDITQEVFIKAYRALPNFRHESAFYTWLYRIAINTAKNALAARGRCPQTEDVDVETAEQIAFGEHPHGHATPENELLAAEMAEAIRSALDALPEDLRTTITLRELEGMSYEEIANAMSCPIGTVRSRIFRAREALNKCIAHLLQD